MCIINVNMAKFDLILIHPPNILNVQDPGSVYNAYLSSANDIAVTDSYEMYPVGLMAIKNYLSAKGMKVKVINLASLLVSEDKVDLYSLLNKQNAVAYGIDLHWQVHLKGALSLVNLIKQLHPKSKVILGGFTSSVYASELAAKKNIDFIVKGFYTLSILNRLLKCLKDKNYAFRRIEGLVWKNDRNEVIVNKAYRSPEKIYHYDVDWSKYIDNFNRMNTFESAYVIMIPSFGCRRSCIWCGGSSYFYRKYLSCNNHLIFRSKASIFRELDSLKHAQKPVNVYSVGHWHERDDYFLPILKKMRSSRVGRVNFELWDLMPLKKVKKVVEYVSPIFVCTPESNDPIVGKACGRGNYSMEELEKWIDMVVSLGGTEIQLWFMIGLPKQTKDSIKRNIEYCKKILTQYGDRGVTAVVSPMVTLDPGSIIADNPDKYGFTLYGKSLSEIERLFSAPYWKYRLNYETKWLSREDIFQLSLNAVMEITKKKNELGLIPDSVVKKVEFEVNASRILAKQIDDDIKVKGYLTDKTKENIMSENKRRQKDNSCILYSVETALDTKWYSYKHADEF